MTDAPKSVPPYQENLDAPVIYFDIVAANGVMNGAIQIELANRILTPVAGSDEVVVQFAACGRLRCSPLAAQQLIDTLTGALAMLQKPQEPTAAFSKLN